MAEHTALLPQAVVWDITYACPLRCVHCYSESGRRATRQLGFDEMTEVLEAIIAMRPGLVSFAGGEPFSVPRIAELVHRVSEAGIDVAISTSGWLARRESIDALTGERRLIAVSVDGATAEVHDRIRGRQGSFARAMDLLAMLDSMAAEKAVNFGIGFTVTRSNFSQLDEFCTEVAPRFRHLSRIDFGTTVPAGLASRAGFAAHEALTVEQMVELGSAAFAERLQAQVPRSVTVTCDDYLDFRMDPGRDPDNGVNQAMFVEPGGEVRAMPMYEGTVGNLRDEPGSLLWSRCIARRSDPFVLETLSSVETTEDWAAAVRWIDRHFGTDDDRSRIDRRPEYTLAAAR
jgi:MoaA/NifB/PqqE/SkfB family radical SAM enzyme